MSHTERRPGAVHQGGDRARRGPSAETSGRGQLDDPDLWLDRDGRVHRGDGPYLNRPLRRLRRALRRWLR